MPSAALPVHVYTCMKPVYYTTICKANANYFSLTTASFPFLCSVYFPSACTVMYVKIIYPHCDKQEENPEY